MTFAAAIPMLHPERLVGLPLRDAGLESLAVAAADAGQFAFHGGTRQVWVDLFVSAVEGLATLPIAVAIVWVAHRAKINRWAVLSAVLATALSIVIVALLQIVGLDFWAAITDVLAEIGFGRFMYEIWPAMVIIFVSSMMFASWLKKRTQRDEAKVFL